MIFKLRTILSNINFFVCCLLAFFLFATGGPFAAWFHVLGRMHPLLLHFPIALIIIYAFWKVIIPVSDQALQLPTEKINADDILLIGSLTASFSALMGLILSQEGSYVADGVFWHKWLGSLTAFGTYLWYSFRSYLNNIRLLNRIVPAAIAVLIIVSGHIGAGITH